MIAKILTIQVHAYHASADEPWMDTPAAGLSRIAGDGEGEKDERSEARCEHRLTMVSYQMQHGHENPTMLDTQVWIVHFTASTEWIAEC